MAGDWKVGGSADSSGTAPSGEDKGMEAASKGTQSGGMVIDPVESGWTAAWSSFLWESRLVQMEGSNWQSEKTVENVSSKTRSY